MKRTVVSFAVGVLMILYFASSVSAEEYQVEEGESLWDIAQQYQTSIKRIKAWQELNVDISNPEKLSSEKTQIENEELYIVERGDTLSHIALDYSVLVEELMEWNELSSDLILIGQELVIKPGESEYEELEGTKRAVAKASTSTSAGSSQPSASEGRTLTVTATAYTAECTGCSGITATGINLNEDRNKKVIAVDPSIIPLGTRVYVEGYGEAIAGDTGGAIQGHKIDIHVPTKSEAFEWGVRTVELTILE